MVKKIGGTGGRVGETRKFDGATTATAGKDFAFEFKVGLDLVVGRLIPAEFFAESDIACGAAHLGEGVKELLGMIGGGHGGQTKGEADLMLVIGKKLSGPHEKREKRI